MTSTFVVPHQTFLPNGLMLFTASKLGKVSYMYNGTSYNAFILQDHSLQDITTQEFFETVLDWISYLQRHANVGSIYGSPEDRWLVDTMAEIDAM